MTSIVSEKCSFCKNEYSLPVKDAKSAMGAIKTAGWLTVSTDGEHRTSCPNEKCIAKLEAWLEDSGQTQIDFEPQDVEVEAEAG